MRSVNLFAIVASVSSDDALGVDVSLTVVPLWVDVGPPGVDYIFSPGVLMGAPGVITTAVGKGPPGVEPGTIAEEPAERVMRLVLSASGI